MAKRLKYKSSVMDLGWIYCTKSAQFTGMSFYC
jgi:hypothetical protein